MRLPHHEILPWFKYLIFGHKFFPETAVMSVGSSVRKTMERVQSLDTKMVVNETERDT